MVIHTPATTSPAPRAASELVVPEVAAVAASSKRSAWRVPPAPYSMTAPNSSQSLT